MKVFSIGKSRINLEKTDSTNMYATTLLLHGSPSDGTVIIAQYQEMGKGQRGAKWLSKPNENILLSIILYPDFLPVSEQFRLNQSISLGVCDCLLAFTDDQVKIKWPNDIYIGNKKAGGILIENSLRGHVMISSIVGIGININQHEFDEELSSATSLKNVTGKTYDLNQVMESLFRSLNNWYGVLRANDLNQINDRYQMSLFRLNEKREYKIENDLVKGFIRGVQEDGKLILEKENGELSYFNNKEIEYVLG